MKRKVRITGGTIAYLIENQEGEMLHTLYEPDYFREKLYRKMDLNAFMSLRDTPSESSYWAMRQVLRDIIKITK